MFVELRDKLFLRKIAKKFRRPLRKHYSRLITKYNLIIVKLIYKNLAKRYGMSAKQVYYCLPLSLQIDKDLEGAYGVCKTGPVVEKKIFRKAKKVRKSTICLNAQDVTTTTFIHEFGHYLRFLIQQVAMHKNKFATDDFKVLVDILRSRADVAENPNDNFWYRGYFTVDEEENFAKSWEQYLKDGKSPDKKHRKLFRDFRKNVFADMYKRSERLKYENYEDLEVKITPERKDFFDALIIGKRLKKESIIIKILEWYVYIMTFFLILKILDKFVIKIF